MIRAKYPDLTALWLQASRKMMVSTGINEKGSCLDWKGSSETYSYSNVLRADSLAYNFDVGRDLSLNRSRFTTLQRAYLHPDDLDSFLARVEKIGLHTANRGVLTTMVVRQKEGVKGKYANGPCIVGYGFRGGRRGPNPTLTLHSRTSYLTYMGGMDLALCNVLGRYIADAINCDVEDIAFEWYSDALLTHNYKQIPMSMVHHQDLIYDEANFPTDNHPSLKLLRREWNIMLDKIDTPLEEEKWGARRRVWRRYRELLAGGGPPDCPVDSLTLDALYSQKGKRAPGTPLWMDEEKRALIQSIKAKSRRNGECLEYTGQQGRPYRSHRGKLYPMARLVLSLNGEFDYDDPELWALHKCDNKLCVKPSHLYAGTPTDNSNDAVERGGLNLGETNGRSVLTEDLALVIRDAAGSQSEIAATYGISQSAVSLIKSGKRWGHV